MQKKPVKDDFLGGYAMDFLKRLSLRYDGEHQTLRIGFGDLLVEIRITEQGRFEVLTSVLLPAEEA